MWTEENSTDSQDTPRTDRNAAPKQLERLRVSSGLVVVIDHFMLANAQLLNMLPPADNEKDKAEWAAAEQVEIRRAVEKYGGTVLNLEAGSWGVLREAGDSLFLLGRFEGNGEMEKEAVSEARGNAAPIGRVFIDTRCVVFVDAVLLGNRAVLDEYRRLRQEGQDKAARDLIRENGAAVRYGFNRDGDELGVFKLPEGAGYALWPDVVDTVGGEGFGGDREAF
jgi:hypothetical protein